MISNQMARKLNIFALILLSLPLVGAFGVQIFLQELPCPLCLLQRMAMLGVAVGILMNIKFGIKPLHYGLSIVAALVGAAISTRQILLHIVPTPDGVTGFGAAVLGLHLYTWALIVFLCSILGVALLMIFMKWSEDMSDKNITLNRIEKAVFALFIIIAVANVLAVFLECGLLPCPDNPTSYKLLS